MKRLLLALLLVAGCDCGGETIINRSTCGDPCYTGDKKTLGVGECHSGITICDNAGIPVCKGEILPSVEECDGFDNDCDGKIDGFYEECSSACGIGKSQCVGGDWTSCTARQPNNETCNGFDDDCDGIVDNSDLMPIEMCYSGPIGTINKGECHPGVRDCEDGMLSECKNEHTPIPEICDGLDNNCNGEIDEGYGLGEAQNIIILDVSASMELLMPNIVTSFAIWQSRHPSTKQKFALILVPNFGDTSLQKPHLYSDFKTIGGFMTDLIGGVQINYLVPEEAVLDAILLATDPLNPLHLSFSSNKMDTRIVVFTDEAGQSYFSNPSVTVRDVGNILKSRGIPSYTFAYTADWIPLGTISGGSTYSFSLFPFLTANDLDDFLKETTCP